MNRFREFESEVFPRSSCFKRQVAFKKLQPIYASELVCYTLGIGRSCYTVARHGGSIWLHLGPQSRWTAFHLKIKRYAKRLL